MREDGSSGQGVTHTHVVIGNSVRTLENIKSKVVPVLVRLKHGYTPIGFKSNVFPNTGC